MWLLEAGLAVGEDVAAGGLCVAARDLAAGDVDIRDVDVAVQTTHVHHRREQQKQ